MATSLTEAEKLDICTILSVDFRQLDWHLNYYASAMTPAVDAAVRDLVATWDGGVGTDFVSIEPKEKNYGVRINSRDYKQDIIKNIAVLLYFDPNSVGASDRLVRS